MKVAHIPSNHPYVRAIDPAAIGRGDDWDIGEIRYSAVDVVHVHFGFEHFETGRISRWIDEVRDVGPSVVHTVHDIDNPHLVDQSEHHERVGALLAHSDAVTTLTESAAHRIRSQWGCDARVIPHPPLARATPPTGPRSARPLVWLGTMRPNVDLDLVRSIVADPDACVDIVVRSEGWDRTHPDLRKLLLAAETDRRITLSIIDRPSDDDLERRIGAARVLVLPYAWGTHSGLVELAAGLGTATVTTPRGCRGDQGALTAAPADLLGLARSVARATTPGPFVPRARLGDVRSAHRRLYDEVRRAPIGVA